MSRGREGSDLSKVCHLRKYEGYMLALEIKEYRSCMLPSKVSRDAGSCLVLCSYNHEYLAVSGPD